MRYATTSVQKREATPMTQNPEESPIHGEVTHLNPGTLHKNPAFTQVITVTGPARTIYIGGQDAVDAQGHIVGKGDLAAQTHQVLITCAMPSLPQTPGRSISSNGTSTWSRDNPCGRVLRPSSSSGEISQTHPSSRASTSGGWHTRIFWWRWMPLRSSRSSSR